MSFTSFFNVMVFILTNNIHNSAIENSSLYNIFVYLLYLYEEKKAGSDHANNLICSTLISNFRSEWAKQKAKIETDRQTHKQIIEKSRLKLYYFWFDIHCLNVVIHWRYYGPSFLLPPTKAWHDCGRWQVYFDANVKVIWTWIDVQQQNRKVIYLYTSIFVWNCYLFKKLIQQRNI